MNNADSPIKDPTDFCPLVVRSCDHDHTQRRFERDLAPIRREAYGFALSMTRNVADAEDLVQETTLRAFTAFHTFQPGTNFKAWFYRIQANLFASYYRKRQRTPEVVVDGSDLGFSGYGTAITDFQEHAANPSDVVIRKMLKERAVAVIATLPEEFQTITRMNLMEGFSYQEIADAVRCPLGTVRSRLHRSRKILRERLPEFTET